MLQDWMPDLRKCIDELLECDAFELQVHMDENGQTNYYLPYMMNDALECYFVLKDCQMKGEYIADSTVIDVELVESETSPALIIRQENGDVATLWFKDVQKELKCYRYHEIGHFWVNGQEQWRQLVYIIGTIYDKYEYMGESICNAQELALLPLMEFAPFRFWSPIHESLDGYYPDTMDGIKCFRELCEVAGDRKLLKWVGLYEKMAGMAGSVCGKLACSGLSFVGKVLASELARSGHEALYELIYKKVYEASSKYPARDYGKVVNERLSLKRAEVAALLASKGFAGEYPRFSKGNLSILVTEEHPFTLSILEYENYGFRIQLMVSETAEKAAFLNQGFFDGTGNRGWIAKTAEEV